MHRLNPAGFSREDGAAFYCCIAAEYLLKEKYKLTFP
jgi:hypothetical protein